MRIHQLTWAAIAAAGCAVAAQGQIIVNGDFETGDFSGWTEFGDTGFNGVWDGFPHGGVYSGFFGPLTSGGISQALNAHAGDRLVVSFWILNEDGSTPNSCVVTLDNQPVFSATDYLPTDYQLVTATITVTHEAPVLSFTFYDEPYYLDVDDITVTLDGSGPPPCYANCDGSSAPPVLNANDFQCFLNKFAAGDSYANCDESSANPVLNANDFQCFLNKFAAGCS